MKTFGVLFEIVRLVSFILSIPFRLADYAYVRYFTFYDNGGKWEKDPMLIVIYNILAILLIIIAIFVAQKYLLG